MKKIVVDMQNYLFGDSIATAFRNSDYDIDAVRTESPKDTVELCRVYKPFVLVMEVTGYTPWMLCERLKLRDEVMSRLQDCSHRRFQHRKTGGEGYQGRKEERYYRPVFLRLDVRRISDGSDLRNVTRSRGETHKRRKINA